MSITISIDLRHVARGLGIPLPQVQAVVELLDEGNTVPFITRYRKDRTGGLDEEQIRQIQSRLEKLRMLADRKQTILRSIEAQGKLTDDLTQQILSAGTTKRLEDLYLPFKPRKQTLATQARARGLEPLAREILAADAACADLDARARDFVNTDKQVTSGADALLGAGHILAEQFSEMAELRQRLRDILQRTGKIVSTQIAPDKPAAEKSDEPKRSERAPKAVATAAPTASAEEVQPIAAVETESIAAAAVAVDPPAIAEVTAAPADLAEVSVMIAEAPAPAETSDAPAAEPVAVEASSDTPAADDPPAASSEEPAIVVEPAVVEVREPAAEATDRVVVAEEPKASESEAVADASPETTTAPGATPVSEAPVATEAPKPKAAPLAKTVSSKKTKAQLKAAKKEAKKKKLEEKRMKAFHDYFSYADDIRKIPPHRVLALNRGERAKVLRVRVECDLEAMYAAIDEVVVPQEHPHAEYLRGCARDALARLILPSLERELRRELTDKAETHAVEVFAKNLRNLLLQPPIRDRKVLAVDPGFKSGCKLAAIDQFGSLLEHAVVFLIGKPERKAEAKQKVLDLVTRHELTVIAVGNGTACRETEDFVAEMLGNELKDKGVAYVIVNEAGASVYSTSQLGREEFPTFDATLRGAISIGRRLQDPLSELVKIDAANIGVGLYQHDVKARHLQTSLDEVVESCVNYVGVDVNSASPALLRYVSGLNQLTARRVYEHRCINGPFRNRQQLHDVSGFGEATYVQAAGFLKIAGGDNPLDATWIHPESYTVTEKLLAKFGFQPADLADKQKTGELAGQIATIDRATVATELGIGALTFRDILSQLTRPGRDPREDLPLPVFKQGVLKLEDLTPSMELTGTVLNVVDFGAFVDIGMHDSGLVHVSHLADRFVRDPHEVVAVGDVVKVWVLEVDKQRRRVSLTMVKPGSERPRYPRGEKPEGQPVEGRRPEGRRPEGGPPRSGGPREGRPPQRQGDRPPHGARPPRGDHPPRGDRPPRGKGGPPPRQRYEMPKPKPKPLVPLTEEMKKGKEPLRTFGDLLQFYQIQHDRPEDAPPKAKAAEEKGAKRVSDPEGSARVFDPADTATEGLPKAAPPVAEQAAAPVEPAISSPAPAAVEVPAPPEAVDVVPTEPAVSPAAGEEGEAK